MTTRAKQRANKSGMEDFPWEEDPEADYYYYLFFFHQTTELISNESNFERFDTSLCSISVA